MESEQTSKAVGASNAGSNCSDDDRLDGEEWHGMKPQAGSRSGDSAV